MKEPKQDTEYIEKQVEELNNILLEDEGNQFDFERMRQALKDTYNKAISDVLGVLPKTIDFTWDNGECTVCGYNDLYDEGTEHTCVEQNLIILKTKSNIEKLKLK